jgi:hypothetical protein
MTAGRRYWFFAGGGHVFVLSADCRNLDDALAVARNYNRHPGPQGRIDLITDRPTVDEARCRVVLMRFGPNPFWS